MRAGPAAWPALLGAMFAVPTLAGQGLAVGQRRPSEVLVAGVVGVAVLTWFAAETWVTCTAEPEWIEAPDDPVGGRLVFPCGGPTGLLAHGFVLLGAPVAGLVMALATPWLRRAARRRRWGL